MRWRDYAIRDQTNLLRSQSFEGDFFFEKLDNNHLSLIINRLRGEVYAISVDPASKEFKTKEYQGLDVAGLIIQLAMGYKAVLRVQMIDDVLAAYEVLGVKQEDGKGKLKMAVKPIGDGANISQKKMFKKAKMEISLAGIAALAPFIYLPSFWSWSSEATEAIYDSRGKTLNFANDVPEEALIWAAAQGADLIEFRFGSSGEGEVIEAVANVEWVKADGERLKVKLSKEGLKGVGKTAKKAKDALDRLNSGSYIVRVGRVAGAFDIEGRGFGGLIPLDVEDGALLKKTRMLGEVELQFKTNDRDRILYINKDDKHTIRSKPVKSYLVELAEKYDEPFRDDFSENGWWWESKQSAIFAMKTERGESVIGMLTGLRWDVKKKVWQGTASLGFAEAERLQKKSTLIDQIWIWDWL
jgi:hypothetical protein